MPIEKNSEPLPVTTTAWASSSAPSSSTMLCMARSTSRGRRVSSAGPASVRVTTRSARSTWSLVMRSRSGTGDDAKLHPAVQRVALIVGAAPHDVLPRADAGGLDARGGLARLRDEAPLDELRPPQREPLVVHLGAGAARVPDDLETGLGFLHLHGDLAQPQGIRPADLGVRPEVRAARAEQELHREIVGGEADGHDPAEGRLRLA